MKLVFTFMVFAVLIWSTNGLEKGKEQERLLRLLKTRVFTITLTTHSIREVTSTVAVPVCSFITRTDTITTFCYFLARRARRRRSNPQISFSRRVTKGEDEKEDKIEDKMEDPAIHLEPSMQVTGGAEPKFLDFFFTSSDEAVWTNRVTNTITDLSVVTVSTPSTVTSFVITEKVLERIFIAGAGPGPPLGLPRCYVI